MLLWDLRLVLGYRLRLRTTNWSQLSLNYQCLYLKPQGRTNVQSKICRSIPLSIWNSKKNRMSQFWQVAAMQVGAVCCGGRVYAWLPGPIFIYLYIYLYLYIFIYIAASWCRVLVVECMHDFQAQYLQWPGPSWSGQHTQTGSDLALRKLIFLDSILVRPCRADTRPSHALLMGRTELCWCTNGNR